MANVGLHSFQAVQVDNLWMQRCELLHGCRSSSADTHPPESRHCDSVGLLVDFCEVANVGRFEMRDHRVFHLGGEHVPGQRWSGSAGSHWEPECELRVDEWRCYFDGEESDGQ